MHNLGIVHPGLTAALTPDFYTGHCTIQQRTDTQDATGQPIPAWANLAGHVNLDCRVGPSGGREAKLADQIYAVTSHTITLAAQYTAITPKMRAVIGAITYDILAVEHDGQSATTHLLCQVLT